MLKSFTHTVATPRKWPGRCSLEALCRARGIDPRRETVRVELRDGRNEEEVDAGRLCDPTVALVVARVGAEIGRVAELRRVDEDRRDDRVALLACSAEKR